jgi:hypothetical protein
VGNIKLGVPDGSFSLDWSPEGEGRGENRSCVGTSDGCPSSSTSCGIGVGAVEFEVGLKLGANDSHSGCTSTNAVAFVVLE